MIFPTYLSDLHQNVLEEPLLTRSEMIEDLRMISERVSNDSSASLHNYQSNHRHLLGTHANIFT